MKATQQSSNERANVTDSPARCFGETVQVSSLLPKSSQEPLDIWKIVDMHWIV